MRLVFPYNIDKASRSKLPGVHGINVEDIIALVFQGNLRTAIMRRNQVAIQLQVIQLFYVHLAPIMPGAQGNSRLIVETILKRQDTFYRIAVSPRKQHIAIVNGIKAGVIFCRVIIQVVADGKTIAEAIALRKIEFMIRTVKLLPQAYEIVEAEVIFFSGVGFKPGIELHTL